MKKLALALLLLPSLASAQAVPEKEFQLTVTSADLQIIGEGIGSLPFNKVAGLMQKLQGQVAPQNRPAQPAPAAKPAEPVQPEDGKRP